MPDSLKSEPRWDRLINKLESDASISQEEQSAIGDLPIRRRTLNAGEDIVREGDTPVESCLVLEGFAFRYKLLSDGRRQTLSFHVPGDIPDLQGLHLRRMDHSLGVTTRTRVAYIPHASLRALFRRYPDLGDVFWRETLVEAAIFREWIVGMGRRSAYVRIAHLFCELKVKFDAVGLATNNAFRLSLTQAELGDALGLSIVHVNRVLQKLKADGLISLRGGTLKALDWEQLKTVGEFDPAYLHLKEPLQRGSQPAE